MSFSNYFYGFKAHGQYFGSPEAANARIKEINEEIFKYGLSDGRLTEWLLIEEGLEQEWEKASKRRQQAEHAQWKKEAIERTLHELEMLKIELNGEREYGGYGYIRRIDWFDKSGNRRISRYTTEGGFLRAYLRMVKADIEIIFAE